MKILTIAIAVFISLLWLSKIIRLHLKRKILRLPTTAPHFKEPTVTTLAKKQSISKLKAVTMTKIFQMLMN